MAQMKAKSKYINSWQKRLFDLIVSVILLVALSPMIILISLLILVCLRLADTILSEASWS
jgi:lipopolysaccharide/colanic/teichoic acid biosynthesis glycosyltransferase